MFETLEEAQKAYDKLAAEHTTATEALEKEKGYSAKWETRAKENENAAPLLEKANARIAELESAQDTGKSEVEKQLAKMQADLAAEQEARKADQEARAAAELTALKTRIGSDKGLPAALVARLSGTDEESIAADADALLAAVPAQGGGFPNLGQGLGAPSADSYKSAIDAALPDRT